jgi:hypothetical protein
MIYLFFSARNSLLPSLRILSRRDVKVRKGFFCVLIDLLDCYFFPFPNRRPDLRRPHGGDRGEGVGVNLGQAHLQPRDLRSVR